MNVNITVGGADDHWQHAEDWQQWRDEQRRRRRGRVLILAVG